MPLEPHPEPPPDLPQRVLPLREVLGDWRRLHARGFSALYFGRTRQNRFDDPEGRFGVLYAGDDAACAFIETFGHATGIRFVSEGELGRRELSTVASTAPLRLVDLTGPGLTALGADNRLGAGDYGCAQRWSAALEAHPSAPDGILYRSRHDTTHRCVALYERCAPHLVETALGTLMARRHRALLAAILDGYDFGLVAG